MTGCYFALLIPLGLAFPLVSALCPGLIVYLFDPEVRCSGIGLVYQVGRKSGRLVGPCRSSAFKLTS